jgi:hypothetical protein
VLLIFVDNKIGPLIQNQIIDIIAKAVLELVKPTSTYYFSLIVDESMDIARHEQVSVCVRYVDPENIKIHELVSFISILAYFTFILKLFYF